MDDPRKVILHPLITEKSTRLIEQLNPKGVPRNAYSFKVSPRASKPEIRQAVQALFNVKVQAVNVLWKKGKRRSTRRGGVTRTPNWKKAFVTLKQGYKIELH